MDQKRMLIAMVLAMVLIVAWQPAFFWIGTKLGYDMSRPQPADATTQPTTQEVASAATMPMASTSPSGVRIAPATKPVETLIGSLVDNDPNWRMGVKLSPIGAGLDSVTLNQYKLKALGKDPFVYEQPYPDNATRSRPLATQSIAVNGAETDLSAVEWNLESSTANTATYSTTLLGESGPVLKVLKTFQLLPPTDPSQGYEVAVTQVFENLTNQPLSFHTSFNGPTAPPEEQERGGDRQIVAGYSQKGYIIVSHDALESLTKDKPLKDYTKDSSGNPALWAGQTSAYFTSVFRPIGDEAKSLSAYLAKITAQTINPEQHEVTMTFATTDLNVAPGQEVTLRLRAFFGPRRREVLKDSDYYSGFPISYNQTLVLTQGICGFCTFQVLIDALVWLLRAFHTIFRDWGLSIIALVILVRVILHPVTKRSQVSMSRMSKMGPEMERLKKKHGDNKDELAKAQMQLYKEQGIAPVLGCLPMFLQMPIWIALWQSLQTTFELRQAQFLWGFTWIHDLSKPDHLLEWQPFKFFFWTFSGLNLLPILMGVVFWLQAKLQPKPVAATPEQAQQQKMMQWMTLLFPLMLYSGPSGLNLYIFTSTLIGIIESKIVRDHIKQQEEAEKSGRVIVDAGKKFKRSAGGNDDLARRESAQDPKPGGLGGFIKKLMDQAEQIRKDAGKPKK